MDIEKHLILIKNEDKTEQIDFCKNYNGQWRIKYHGNSKLYTYNNRNVVWYSDPNRIDHNTHIRYINNQPISGINNILDFGSHVKIFFKNGYKKTYPSSYIIIEQNCLSNNKATNCFDYLKTLANHLSVKAIFPFGFNAGQKSATEKAMTEQVSIIEGPPGTGKTQTILNIIANAIINKKTVAVVSNNNAATANVFEKLQKYGLDFIAAYLGNKENKEAFFAEQNGTYKDLSNWVLDPMLLHGTVTIS